MIISEKIPSQLDLIPDFIHNFMEKIKVLSLGHDEIFDIKLSLEEALVNAIKHGNKMNLNQVVEFQADITDSQLVIKVTNAGPGFDFTSIPNPTEKDRLEKTSGRGIFLIKKLMDKVEFSDCGRTIKMVKFFRKGDKSEHNPRESF